MLKKGERVGVERWPGSAERQLGILALKRIGRIAGEISGVRRLASANFLTP